MSKPLLLLLPYAAYFRWAARAGGQPLVSDRTAFTGSRASAIGTMSCWRYDKALRSSANAPAARRSAALAPI
jgi:hypothetical protein